MTIDFKTAEKLCTAAEYSLLKQTGSGAISKLSAADLLRKARLARRYSDKWRGQAIKKGGSLGLLAVASQTKHEFFAAAVSLFEERLMKLTSPAPAGPGPVAKKQTPSAQPKKAPAKPAKASRKKAAQKKVAARKTASASAPKSAPAKKAAVKNPPRNAVSLSRETKGIQKGRVTRQVLDKSGQNSRIKSHVSASGRRNQAARSSRKRS
jgi:hypothetical protein